MVKQREFSRANNVHFAGAARVLLCRVAHLSDQGAHHVFLESYVLKTRQKGTHTEEEVVWMARFGYFTTVGRIFG